MGEIDAQFYQPDASTPLYDAIGFSVNKLRQKLASKKDYNVLVTILTDGEENALREYSGAAARRGATGQTDTAKVVFNLIK